MLRTLIPAHLHRARLAGVFAVATLALLVAMPARGAETESASQLIEKLGLHVAPKPVRERDGWRPPRTVLVAPQLHNLLPLLQQAAPNVKVIELPAASAGDIAGADASIGVCSVEVLSQAKQLQWIQGPAAGIERCVQQPLVRERKLLLTNLQRTMGRA